MKKIICLLSLLILSSCYHLYTPYGPDMSTSHKTITVVTYNIKIGLINLDIVADNLQKLQPDIVLLQEVHGPAAPNNTFNKANQAEFLSNQLDMNYVFAKAKNWPSGEYGIAILTKFPIVDQQMTLLPNLPGEEQEVFVKVLVDTGEGLLMVYNTHLISNSKNNHDAPALRLQQAKVILQDILQQRGPVVFGGDLNAWGLSKVRTLFQNNFNDTFDNAGVGYGATFPNYFPIIRPDYLFVNQYMTAKSSQVLHVNGSDHFPLVSRIYIKKLPIIY